MSDVALLSSDIPDEFPTDAVCFGRGTLGVFKRFCGNKPRIRLLVSNLEQRGNFTETWEANGGWVTQYCLECFDTYMGETLAQARQNVEFVRRKT